MASIRTIRRDKLKRDIAKGLYVAKCDGRYTDDYRFDEANNYGKTEFMEISTNENEYGCGKLILRDNYFNGYGRAWEDSDGTICLYVHSNLSYTLKKKSA